MTGLLEALGVQARPFRALLRAYVAIDLRGQFYGEATNVGARELVSPLFWVVGQFLTVSLLLCAMLQARVDAWFYAASNLAVTAVLVFAAVVVEFHEAAFDPTDVEVVGHRPVAARTWSAARLCNLALYVGLMAVAVVLFPTAMGVGLTDASWSWLLAYPLAAGCTALTAAGLALLLYTLAGTGAGLEPLRRAAAWIQILAILALFYGGQLMLRNATGSVEYFAARPPEWVYALPTSWLARAVVAADPVGLSAAVVVALAVSGLALTRLSAVWAGVGQARSAAVVREYPPPPVPGQLGTTVARAVTATRRESAVFQLTTTILARDPELRTRNLSVLALPVAAALLGVLTGQYADPRVAGVADAVLPVGTAALLAMAVPTVLINLQTSPDHAASWRLAWAWGRDARRGARKAVLLRFFAPVWAAHAAALAVLWDPVAALVHTAVGWLVVEVVARAVARTLLRDPVLSRPPRLGSTVGGAPMVVAGASALASVLAAGWLAAAPHTIALAGFGVGLAVAAVAIDRSGP